MIKRLCFILLLLLSGASHGRDFEDSYAVYGAGAKTCSIYVRAMERGGPEQDYFIDWVIGYLSAFNVIMPDTYDILGETEFTTAQNWLEIHCQKFPRELVITAVARLTEVLYPTRYQSGLKEPLPASESTEKPEATLNDVKIQ